MPFASDVSPAGARIFSSPSQVSIPTLNSLDRKSTGLKSLQGKIWRQGYENGSLQAQVFADVAPALERWRERGLRISIFSSGSVLAQQLLFAHTEVGDLTPLIDSYFDTTVGKKGDADSYRKIAVASQARMKTILSIRPGNEPQPQYPSIRSFDEIR